MISPEIIVEILNGYNLPQLGIHGVSHWGRVLEIGQKIAARNGADISVVEYFAVFHDCRRENEGRDPEHGSRGAQLAERLESKLGLTDAQLEELKYSCRNHTDGATAGSVTVQTCWDSDRLDLWRVGIRPSPDHLCTKQGKSRELLKWSRLRSIENYFPECSIEWMRLLESR